MLAMTRLPEGDISFAGTPRRCLLLGGCEEQRQQEADDLHVDAHGAHRLHALVEALKPAAAAAATAAAHRARVFFPLW